MELYAGCVRSTSFLYNFVQFFFEGKIVEIVSKNLKLCKKSSTIRL